MELSVIIPARNEQTVLGECVQSLVAQSEADGFALGREWELLLVDDGSTDGTRALMDGFAAEGVLVMSAPELAAKGKERAFTGKTNACWAAAQQARGSWLLFTDADTLHEAGSLRRALHEGGKHRVALLSYSPRQIVAGVAQQLLMPLVFSELASVYPPAQINEPASRVAAANGQFLLVERAAYFATGGHRAVGRSVLEDVDLAWNVKRYAAKQAGTSGGIRLRYAPDAVAARMYRGFADMAEGWTKNLALLFPHTLALAAWRTLDAALLFLPVLLLLPYLVVWQKAAIVLLWARTLLRFYTRVARSNFPAVQCALAPLGLPLFVALLVRSWMAHKIFHRVAWKGRQYPSGR